MGAEVIPLPILERQPSCFICVHAAFGSMTYCMKFDEVIMNERSAAEDCDLFEDDPTKG